MIARACRAAAAAARRCATGCAARSTASITSRRTARSPAFRTAALQRPPSSWARRCHSRGYLGVSTTNAPPSSWKWLDLSCSNGGKVGSLYVARARLYSKAHSAQGVTEPRNIAATIIVRPLFEVAGETSASIEKALLAVGALCEKRAECFDDVTEAVGSMGIGERVHIVASSDAMPLRVRVRERRAARVRGGAGSQEGRGCAGAVEGGPPPSCARSRVAATTGAWAAPRCASS